MDDQFPKFFHDCDRCTFHGTSNGHDLYSCSSRFGVELIVRFGGEAHENFGALADRIRESIDAGGILPGHYKCYKMILDAIDTQDKNTNR
jgi:hypothetical protein